MSHVAARAAAPSDNTVVQVRHPSAKRGSDAGAHADFGRHVDDLTGGLESPDKVVLATGRDRPANPRWQHPIDAEPQTPPPDGEPAVEPETVEAGDSTAVDEPGDAVPPPSLSALDPLLLAGDVASAAATLGAVAVSPAQPSEPGPVVANDTPRPGTSSRLLAALLAEAPDTANAPTEPGDLPRLELVMEAQETPRRGPDVLVIARETHLPPAALPSPTLQPAALPPAMRARPSGEGGTSPPRADAAAPKSEARLGNAAPANTGADPTTSAAAEPVAQPRRSNKDAGQSATSSGEPPASPTPARSSPTDAPQRARVQIKGETSFDPVQPTQLARTSARDEHPAPPQAAIPVTRQIVDGIAAEIAPPHDTGRTGPASAAAPTPPPQPLKVMTIQLNPAELGTLTVRISLRNDALELQVEASRRETARMVDSDRDALSSLLRSAGYQVEAVTVRAVEQPAPPVATGAATGSPDGAPPQPQRDGSQTDQRSSGGRDHADGHREGHGTRRDTRGEEGGFGARPRRGRYV